MCEITLIPELQLSINYGTINVVALDTWAGMTGVCVSVVVQLCSFRGHHPFDCCWRAVLANSM